MATTLETLGLDRLSLQERIDLVQQLWDSIAEETSDLPLTEAQRQELDRRIEHSDTHRDDVIPWEQVKAEALARWSR